MAAWETTGCHHHILADCAVFELADFAGLEVLTLSVDLILLGTLAWVMEWTLVLRVFFDDELDQWEVALQSLHEFSELNVFRHVSTHLHQRLVDLLSEEEMVEQAHIKTSYQNKKAQMQKVHEIRQEIKQELTLDQIDLGLVVVFHRQLLRWCSSFLTVFGAVGHQVIPLGKLLKA